MYLKLYIYLFIEGNKVNLSILRVELKKFLLHILLHYYIM